MATDMKLDENHDLYFDGRDLGLVKEGSQVAQKAKIKLLFVLSEWIYDITLGVDWWNEMFNTDVPIARKKQTLVDVLASTTGINKILEMKFAVDGENNGALIEFTANTIYSTEVRGALSVGI